LEKRQKVENVGNARGKAGEVIAVNNIHDALKEIKRISNLQANVKISRGTYFLKL